MGTRESRFAVNVEDLGGLRKKAKFSKEVHYGPNDQQFLVETGVWRVEGI